MHNKKHELLPQHNAVKCFKEIKQTFENFRIAEGLKFICNKILHSNLHLRSIDKPHILIVKINLRIMRNKYHKANLS